MKNQIKKIIRFLINPRLILCTLLAWFITNGWSYVVFGIGIWFHIDWMTAIAGAYLAFLWLPFSPEKLFTFTIAIALLRFLFPKDQHTLSVLRTIYTKAKQSMQAKKHRKQQNNDRICKK